MTPYDMEDTNMVGKIDFFDTDNVGPAARRLAFCFNISARMVSQDGNPLSHAEQLFRETTGLDAVPAFNEDERNYLRLKLIETAAIRDQREVYSLDELDEAANVLFLDAREMKLIRAEDPRPGAERHFSFPGQ